jgi:hypothetical protein
MDGNNGGDNWTPRAVVAGKGIYIVIRDLIHGFFESLKLATTWLQFTLKGLGKSITNTGSGLNNVMQFISHIGKPIMWIIGTILLIIVIMFLASSASNSMFPNDKKSGGENNIYVSLGGQSKPSQSFLSTQPKLGEMPEFSLFNFNYYSNFLKNNEPFASGIAYSNVILNIASNKNIQTTDRPLLSGGNGNRADYISVITKKEEDDVEKYYNVLKPRDIAWKMKENEHRDFQNLPRDFQEKHRIDGNTTKTIAWEQKNNEWILKCPAGTELINNTNTCRISSHKKDDNNVTNPVYVV